MGHSLSAFKEKLKENQKILSQLNAEIVAAEKKVKEAEKVAAKSKKELDEVSSMRDRQLTGACACVRLFVCVRSFVCVRLLMCVRLLVSLCVCLRACVRACCVCMRVCGSLQSSITNGSRGGIVNERGRGVLEHHRSCCRLHKIRLGADYEPREGASVLQDEDPDAKRRRPEGSRLERGPTPRRPHEAPRHAKRRSAGTWGHNML